MPTVLITGCSSGIGRALADAFRDAGHEVWATARKPDDVDTLLAAGFAARQLDVNDGEALTRLADELEDRHGGLDILINNAGYGAMGPLLDGGVEAMRQQFETNVFALVGVTRALFPLLRRSRGLVVNIGSVSGVLVTPFAGAYCASKAAVHGLTDALRLELAPFGIQVMEVQPGQSPRSSPAMPSNRPSRYWRATRRGGRCANRYRPERGHRRTDRLRRRCLPSACWPPRASRQCRRWYESAMAARRCR